MRWCDGGGNPYPLPRGFPSKTHQLEVAGAAVGLGLALLSWRKSSSPNITGWGGPQCSIPQSLYLLPEKRPADLPVCSWVISGTTAISSSHPNEAVRALAGCRLLLVVP